MVTTKKTKAEVELIFDRTDTSQFEVAIIGTTPFIAHRMGDKAKRQILFPSGRMNQAKKAATLKHNPYDEFREAPYQLKGSDAPTLLAIPAAMFKGAMNVASLDLAGASKAQTGRLVFVTGELLPLYGEPRLLMSITRLNDVARTPDIRTRAILPEWATIITVRYVVPRLTQASVINLLIAAGFTAGVGDWRPEKGKGNYGQFEITNRDDPRIVRIMEQGRVIQERAMADPIPYDDETEDLLDWYNSEYLRRFGTNVDVSNGASEDEVEEEDLEVLV